MFHHVMAGEGSMRRLPLSKLGAVSRCRANTISRGFTASTNGEEEPKQTKPQPFNAFSRFVTEPKRVRIVGAPLSHGQKLLGVDKGPASIRGHGLLERLVSQDECPPHQKRRGLGRLTIHLYVYGSARTSG